MTDKMFDVKTGGLLTIDMQPFYINEWEFREKTGNIQGVAERIRHLFMLADWLNLPTVATFEEPVDQNGMLPESLESVFPKNGHRVFKDAHNCVAEAKNIEVFRNLGIKRFAVTGIETDVCVFQSVMGLLDSGYEVLLLEDCLWTSEPDHRLSIERMYDAGAVRGSFKMFCYELTRYVSNCPWMDHLTPIPDAFPKEFNKPEEVVQTNPIPK